MLSVFKISYTEKSQRSETYIGRTSAVCNLTFKALSYLGSQTNHTNAISSEIKARILSPNQCYYAYGKLMKSRALNRSSKLKIYKCLIRPVVTYGCEAWTLTDRDEQYLRIFECRILRKIFGAVQNEDGSW